MNLLSGFVLPEGLASNNNAHVCAIAKCEMYRIRMVDVALAVHAHPAAKRWFARFEELVAEARRRLTFRLESASGAAASKVKKALDEDMRKFKLKDKRSSTIMRQTIQEFGPVSDNRMRSKSCSSLNSSGKAMRPSFDASSPLSTGGLAVLQRASSPKSTTSAENWNMPPLLGATYERPRTWHDWGIKPPGSLCLTLCGLGKQAVK